MENPDPFDINHTGATIRTLGQWMNVGAHQYYIAIYQRKYEWGETEVGILLQDILERRIPGLQNRDGINANVMAQNQIRQLFLSQIMLQQMGEQDGLTRYSVVDGQQRLVTIVIIYAVLQFRYHEIQHGGIDAQERERARVAANDIRRRMVDDHNNSIIIRQLPNAINPQQPNRANNAYQPIRPEIFSFDYGEYTRAQGQNGEGNQRQLYLGTEDLALILLSARNPRGNRFQNCSPAVRNAVKVRDWIRESRAAGGRGLIVSELDWLLEFQFALENMVYWTTTVTASLDIAMSSFRSLNSRYTSKPLQTKDVLKVLVSRVPNEGDVEEQTRASMAKIAIWSGVEESVDTFCNDIVQKELDLRLWVGRLGSGNTKPSQRPDSIMNQLCRIVATWKLNGYLEEADEIAFPEFMRSCSKINNNELESLFLIDFRADHQDYQHFERDMELAWEIVSDIWHRRWTGRPQPRNRGALVHMAHVFVKTFEWLEGIQSLHWQPLLVRFLNDFFLLAPWEAEAQRKKKKRKNSDDADDRTIDARLYEVLCKLSLLVFSIEAGKDGTFLTRRGIFADMFNNMRRDIREHYTIDSNSVIVWWAALLNLYIQDAQNAETADDLLVNFDALISAALGQQHQFQNQVRIIPVFEGQNFPIYSHEHFEEQSVKKVLMQRLAICPLNHNHSFTKAVLYAIYDQTIDGADGTDMSVEHLLPQSKVCDGDGLVDRRSGWYSTFQDRDGVVRARLLNMLGNFHLLPATNNAQLRDSGPHEKATVMARANFYRIGHTYNQDRHDATIAFLRGLASIGNNRGLGPEDKTVQTIELYKERHRNMLKSFSDQFRIYEDAEFDDMWREEWGPGWQVRIYNEIDNDVVIID